MNINYRKLLIALIAIPLFSVSIVSCEEDEDDEIETRIIEKVVEPNRYSVTINMKQQIDGVDLVMNTTDKPYTNELGQAYNVTRLRYLLSDISFHKADGSCFTINEYHLIDASDSATLVFTPSAMVPEGDYTSVSFNFGFDKEDNVPSAYPDLTSAFWKWPDMLGSGYHFMQFEGKFDTTGVEGGFATHMGTARNNTVSPTTYEDNHFEAKPINSAITISSDDTFDIIMNLEEWYKNPYTWDFKVYNQPIMPIYDAQRKLNLNGPSVFTVNI